MTPEQAKLLKLTFAQAMTNKDQVGRMFYERLFAIAPDTRPLFRGDFDAQSRKLMDTLGLALGMLRDMPKLMQTLEALAVRHVAYGVKDEHYAKVREALLWTLEQVLGAAFTADARAAWTALFQAVCDIMLKAAHGAASGRPAVA